MLPAPPPKSTSSCTHRLAPGIVMTIHCSAYRMVEDSGSLSSNAIVNLTYEQKLCIRDLYINYQTLY
jgi:hypothetical protein